MLIHSGRRFPKRSVIISPVVRHSFSPGNGSGITGGIIRQHFRRDSQLFHHVCVRLSVFCRNWVCRAFLSGAYCLVVSLQIPRQLLHRMIPLLWVKGAGFQDDSGQLRAAVDGGRDCLAREAAVLGFLPLNAAGDLFAQREKGQGPLIHHPVHHKTQGVDIRRGAVVLPVCYLRGHVAVGTG